MSESESGQERQRWLRDFARFLHLKPQYVFSGNVRDYQVAEARAGQLTAKSFIEVISAERRGALTLEAKSKPKGVARRREVKSEQALPQRPSVTSRILSK